MKYTPNYGLKKPEQDDFYNVEDFNENADIIDQKLKEVVDDLASHKNETAQNHVHGLSPERVRAIYVSTDDPDDEIGEDGDIWIKYEE